MCRRYAAFISFLVVGSVLLRASPLTANESAQWNIDPSGKTGPITPRMTEASLIKTFGKQSVTWGDCDIGEGQSVPGTILFPDDPTRRLEIMWEDNKNRSLPKQARVYGEKTRWVTWGGVTLGTTLKDLEHLNGKPFELYGFEWDYSGQVKSWNGGIVQERFGDNRFVVRFSPPEDTTASEQERNTVAGDSTFSSSNPVMQKINPRVYDIIWFFR